MTFIIAIRDLAGVRGSYLKYNLLHASQPSPFETPRTIVIASPVTNDVNTAYTSGPYVSVSSSVHPSMPSNVKMSKSLPFFTMRSRAVLTRALADPTAVRNWKQNSFQFWPLNLSTLRKNRSSKCDPLASFTPPPGFAAPAPIAALTAALIMTSISYAVNVAMIKMWFDFRWKSAFSSDAPLPCGSAREEQRFPAARAHGKA